MPVSHRTLFSAVPSSGWASFWFPSSVWFETWHGKRKFSLHYFKWEFSPFCFPFLFFFIQKNKKLILSTKLIIFHHKKPMDDYTSKMRFHDNFHWKCILQIYHTESHWLIFKGKRWFTINYRYKRTMHKTLKEEVQEKEKLHEDPTPVVIKMTKKRYVLWGQGIWCTCIQ